MQSQPAPGRQQQFFLYLDCFKISANSQFFKRALPISSRINFSGFGRRKKEEGRESPKLGFSERTAYSYFHVSLWSCKWTTTDRVMCQHKCFLPKGESSVGPGIQIYTYHSRCGSYILTLPKYSIFTALFFPSCMFSKMQELPTLSSYLQCRHYLFIYLCFRKERNLLQRKNVKMFQKEMTTK